MKNFINESVANATINSIRKLAFLANRATALNTMDDYLNLSSGIFGENSDSSNLSTIMECVKQAESLRDNLEVQFSAIQWGTKYEFWYTSSCNLEDFVAPLLSLLDTLMEWSDENDTQEVWDRASSLKSEVEWAYESIYYLERANV